MNFPKEILNKSSVVVCKHNNLINASYKLNLGEQKLVLAISSMVNPQDEEFKEYYLSVDEFAKLMDIDLRKNRSLYTRLKRKSSLLLSKRLTIHEPDGDLQTTWFASIKYFNAEAKMAFCFAPRLKKYYLKLQQYTKYRLKNIAKLNSIYSIRLYELLKQYEKIRIREFKNLDDLKLLIGLENEYTRFYDFKNRVLFVAQRELKEKTDISFDFEPIKKGRTIKGIRFYITSNKENKNINSSLDKVNIVKELLKIESNQAKKILKEANDDINLIKEKYNILCSSSNIRDITGWMIKAIRQDYKKTIYNEKSTFNNFPQRDYDFEELEKKLLGKI